MPPGIKMKKILVIGSLNMDLVTTTDRVPIIGETIYGTGFHTYPGGKGANQAVACARLGNRVTMIGCVGNDEFGNTLAKNLADNNININCIEKLENINTGIATIVVANHDNFIILDTGANALVTPEYIEKYADEISSSDYIILQNEVPMETNIKILTDSSRKAKIIYNPAPAVKIPQEYFEYIDYFIPNQHECGFILENSIETVEDGLIAVKKLNELGIRNVIITMGKDGAVFNDKNEAKHMPCPVVKVLDTTAAGDSFCAGIVTGLSENMSITEAVRFATAVASLTVTKEGAQSSLPHLKEVETFLA